jgi:hypothetical protein
MAKAFAPALPPPSPPVKSPIATAKSATKFVAAKSYSPRNGASFPLPPKTRPRVRSPTHPLHHRSAHRALLARKHGKDRWTNSDHRSCHSHGFLGCPSRQKPRALHFVEDAKGNPSRTSPGGRTHRGSPRPNRGHRTAHARTPHRPCRLRPNDAGYKKIRSQSPTRTIRGKSQNALQRPIRKHRESPPSRRRRNRRLELFLTIPRFWLIGNSLMGKKHATF